MRQFYIIMSLCLLLFIGVLDAESNTDKIAGTIVSAEMGTGSAGYYYINILKDDGEEICMMGTLGQTLMRIGKREFYLTYDDFNRFGRQWKKVTIKLKQPFKRGGDGCSANSIYGIRVH